MSSTATPQEIMEKAASLLNDTAQTIYTNAAVLPYLNIAMGDLDEAFQQNNIPVTNETSAAILVKAGVTRIGFGTTPSLPGDLVEIQRLYERSPGIEPWVPVERKEFIPKTLEDQSIEQFLFWAWVKQEIRLIEATADNELKIDYIATLFPEIKIGDIGVRLSVVNVKQHLTFATASLCAMYIGENETRAAALSSQPQTALERELGIPTKGSGSARDGRMLKISFPPMMIFTTKC